MYSKSTAVQTATDGDSGALHSMMHQTTSPHSALKCTADHSTAEAAAAAAADKSTHMRNMPQYVCAVTTRSMSWQWPGVLGPNAVC